MNTTIANFIGAIVAQTSFTMLLFVAVFLLGILYGRKSAIPFRKTRYFVDEYGRLRRWKFGKNVTEICWSGTCWVWFDIAYKLPYLLKNCQEIDSLTAYRMFPKAFKKPQIEVPESPKTQLLFRVFDKNMPYRTVFQGSEETCKSYVAKANADLRDEIFATAATDVKFTQPIYKHS